MVNMWTVPVTLTLLVLSSLRAWRAVGNTVGPYCVASVVSDSLQPYEL